MNRIIAIDTRIATLVPALTKATVLSRHRTVINLCLPKVCFTYPIALVSESVAYGPRQIRFANLPTQNSVSLLGLSKQTALKKYDCTLQHPSAPVVQAQIDIAWQYLQAAAGTPPDDFSYIVQQRLQQAISGLMLALQNKTGDLKPYVAALLGLGTGLTPSGDDFLCGLLIAMHLPTAPANISLSALQCAVSVQLAKTHAISAAFLMDAILGKVSVPVQHFITALHNPYANIHPALDTLTALGHRSGFDLLSGLLAGFDFSYDRSKVLCPYIAD